jgi:hypothetical protein
MSRPCGCTSEPGDPHMSDCPLLTAHQDEYPDEEFWGPEDHYGS